ncbi:45_t:CDS:2, partial [Gigaspora rosea]
SSQRIKALNALLKMGVNHMSSLCHLYEECQRLFDNQAQYSQLEEYQNSVPTRGLPIASQVIFPQIDSILIKLVTPHILSIQRQQMNKSLLYHAARLEVPVSEFNNNELESDILDSNFTEDLNNYPRIPLSTIATNETPLTEEMYNQFNLEYLKQMRSNNMTNSEMSYNISKKTRYSTGFGVLKKALKLAISLNCDELLSILHRFIEDKQKLSTNYSTIDNDNNKDHTNTNQNSDNSDDPIQVTDPLVVRKRGRSFNRLKSSTECDNIV